MRSILVDLVALQYHHGPPFQVPLHYTSTRHEPALASSHVSPRAEVTSLKDYQTGSHLGILHDAEDVSTGIPREQHDDSLPIIHVSADENSLKKDDEMKQIKTKASIGALATLLSYFSLNNLYQAICPDASNSSADDEMNMSWTGSPHSWLDRKACSWFSMCGGSFANRMSFYGPHVCHWTQDSGSKEDEDECDWRDAWTGKDSHDPKNYTTRGDIPEYVFEYAPLVHLFSKEQYWPCDIADHLDHTTPALNYTSIDSEQQHPTLRNLNQLNRFDFAREVYLTSDDDAEKHPEWLEGAKNIPAKNITTDRISDNNGWAHQPGRTYWQAPEDVAGNSKDRQSSSDRQWEHDEAHQRSASTEYASKMRSEAARLLRDELKRRAENTGKNGLGETVRGGRSDAPAILIVVEKNCGVVDAFWFFFYSFNLGNSVLTVRFGNHIGDWEHSAVRFHHGKPKAVYFSEHSFGKAYSYEAVEKFGVRPVIYSAVGTHAMYPRPGKHPYVLPGGILHDETDRGPLWDPALNAKIYTYDYTRRMLRPSTLNPNAPLGWFYFAGRWGDKTYPHGDPRQYEFAGQHHYVSGPYGPRFKNLGRNKICPGPPEIPCNIKNWLGPESRAQRWQGTGEEADAFSAAVGGLD